MTPEELANARALLPVPIGSGQTIKASGDAAVRRRKVVEMFPELIAHIDAQAAQISFLDSRCNDLLEANEALKHEFMESNVLDLKRQIIELSDSAVREESKKDEQIEAMKEKLVEVKAIGLFNSPWDSGLPDGCGYDAEMAACRDEARQQLKADPDLKKAGVEWE